MSLQEKIKDWIERPELLNQETLLELKGVLDKYPYYQTVRLLYLKNLYLLKDESFEEELRKSALFVADLSVLFYFIEGERFVIKAQEQEIRNLREHETEGKNVDRTLDLIDRFLSEMPASDQASDLSALNVAVVGDYTSVLESQSCILRRGDPCGRPTTAAGVHSLATARVAPTSENQVATASPEQSWSDEEDDYVTETLARIYVKQQRYDKALEIIRKINLKYPEKSTYFADQIRFLEKLIINAKTK